MYKLAVNLPIQSTSIVVHTSDAAVLIRELKDNRDVTIKIDGKIHY